MRVYPTWRNTFEAGLDAVGPTQIRTLSEAAQYLKQLNRIFQQAFKTGKHSPSSATEQTMGLEYDIDIQISGPEHQGKTSLVAYLSKLLTDAGADLIVQRTDGQIEEKLALSPDQLREKFAGKRIFLREVQHFP